MVRSSNQPVIQKDVKSPLLPPVEELSNRNDSSLGHCIEDFELIRLVGRGGFGCVYQARSKHNNREVAIKMIDKKLMISSGMVDRVRNEVAVHYKLKHPAILELYCYFEDASAVYLVLEFAIHGELPQYLALKHGHNNTIKKGNCTAVSEEESRDYMIMLVDGLAYLHSCGILHRDLKLSNILVANSGQIKLADFGLAAQLEGGSADRSHLTLCGTPNFISPEVVLRRPHSFKSDIFSLGCIFYTLLMGVPPFSAGGVRATLACVVNNPVTIADSFSHNARDLLLQLLQKEPTARPSLDAVSIHPFLQSATKMEELTPPSSIGPLLVPLSTKRLRPIRQCTRTSVVNITAGGDVLLELLRRHDGTVYEFFSISSDGQSITVRRQSGQRHYSSLKLLPARYTAKYRYAAHFVDLVASKTPKVTFYSKRAKAALMENGDFEARFYDGSKVTIGKEGKGRKKVLRSNDSNGTTDVVDYVDQVDDGNALLLEEDISNFTLVQHALWSMARCCSANAVLKDFPVTLSRRPPLSETTPERVSRVSESLMKDSGVDVEIPSTTSPSSYFASSVASTFKAPSSFCATSTISTIKASNNFKTAFVEGVGWAIHLKNQIYILLLDGQQLCVSIDGKSVSTDQNVGTTKSTWIPISLASSSIKECLLKHMPAFVSKLQLQRTK